MTEDGEDIANALLLLYLLVHKLSDEVGGGTVVLLVGYVSQLIDGSRYLALVLEGFLKGIFR